MNHRHLLALTILLTLFVSSMVPPRLVTAASAPPLRSLQIISVASAKHPAPENVDGMKFTTVYDHGGAWLQVVTRELGYGGIGIARFGNVRATLVKTERILNGRTLIGYFYTWRIANPAATGKFTYQNTSLNSPWNTMTDYINIK